MKKLVTPLLAVGATLVAIIYPMLTYYEGTATDVSVTVVQEPFISGDVLVYRWSGDVYRSCDVTIQRSFVDSYNVVTTLTSLDFKAIPSSMKGKMEYEVTIPVPRMIAAGKAKYRAVEVPQCSWLQRLLPIAVPYPDVTFIVTRVDQQRGKL